MNKLVALTFALCVSAPAFAQDAQEAQIAPVLQAGTYLVTASRVDACVTQKLNLVLARKYNVAADALPEAIVSVGSIVKDNLMHAQICFERPTPSEGTIVVTVTEPTVLKTTGAGSPQIVKVEKIVEQEAVALDAVAAPLAAGRYAVELQGPAGCANIVDNVIESLNYDDNDTLTINLAPGKAVVDDLFHTMECRLGAVATATAYVDIQEGQAAVAATNGFTVTGLSKITAVEAVNPQ